MPFAVRTLDSGLGAQRPGFRVVDTDAPRGTVRMNDSSCFMAEPPNVKLTVNGTPVEDGGTATVSDTNRRRSERVTFDARGSMDPDGAIARYRFFQWRVAGRETPWWPHSMRQRPALLQRLRRICLA